MALISCSPLARNGPLVTPHTIPLKALESKRPASSFSLEQHFLNTYCAPSFMPSCKVCVLVHVEGQDV